MPRRHGPSGAFALTIATVLLAGCGRKTIDDNKAAKNGVAEGAKVVDFLFGPGGTRGKWILG